MNSWNPNRVNTCRTTTHQQQTGTQMCSEAGKRLARIVQVQLRSEQSSMTCARTNLRQTVHRKWLSCKQVFARSNAHAASNTSTSAGKASPHQCQVLLVHSWAGCPCASHTQQALAAQQPEQHNTATDHHMCRSIHARPHSTHTSSHCP